MTQQPQVNRYLDDKFFDRIDHALGRPVNPARETYRNYFAANIDAANAAEMTASPCWHVGNRTGDLVFFHVTDHGRRALVHHLREISSPHRHFVVTWRGRTADIASTSHSAAKYDAWLRISDTCDVPFGEFIKSARARLAS